MDEELELRLFDLKIGFICVCLFILGLCVVLKPEYTQQSITRMPKSIAAYPISDMEIGDIRYVDSKSIIMRPDRTLYIQSIDSCYPNSFKKKPNVDFTESNVVVRVMLTKNGYEVALPNNLELEPDGAEISFLKPISALRFY